MPAQKPPTITVSASTITPACVALNRRIRQGIKRVKESPPRFEAVKQALRQMSGELKAFCLVTGQYGFVGVLEGSDDEIAARIMLAVGMRGVRRSEMLRAFEEERRMKNTAATARTRWRPHRTPSVRRGRFPH